MRGIYKSAIAAHKFDAWELRKTREESVKVCAQNGCEVCVRGSRDTARNHFYHR